MHLEWLYLMQRRPSNIVCKAIVCQNSCIKLLYSQRVQQLDLEKAQNFQLTSEVDIL